MEKSKNSRAKMIASFVGWTALVIVALTVNSAAFVVKEGQQAAVFQFQKPIAEYKTPGLKWKLPFVQNVLFLDAKYFLYDSSPKEAITKDKKTVVVDGFALVRITDPTKFIRIAGTKAGGLLRVDDIVYSNMNESFGKNDYVQIVVTERETILDEVTENSARRLNPFSLDLKMFRVSRVELPEENKEAAYERMRSERNEKAQVYRSEGQEQARIITSDADRRAAELLAAAQESSKVLRAEADAEAANIYSAAYEQNPELFRLLRGIEAAQSIIKDGDAQFVLDGSQAFLAPLLE